MVDSPQDLYAKFLPNNRGYPLWFPEPSSTLPSSHQQDGLQIGDVGYVSHMGKFIVLFNITYGQNHALHQRLGVSFSFDQTEFANIDREVDVMPNADPPGCIITSHGITQPNKQTPRRVGHHEFNASSDKGAILILPDGATSHDLPANEHFRELAVEHAHDWYKFAKKRYGESIGSDSLYLITGFYKARSWSLASFHDTTVSTEPRKIWVVPREGERTTTGREWKCTFPVQYRDGPGPNHNGSVNQTVFISGFKIAVRDDVLGWLSNRPEVQPVPAIRPRKGHCRFAKVLLQLLRKNDSLKRRHKVYGGADVKHIPALSQPFHPSDIINRYLLNKDSDALVAVTHDSEWMSLIETGEFTPEELTEVDRLEEYLSEHYSLVSQPENSAVHLQKITFEVPKSEELWYTEPSADNLQVAITRIRAEDVTVGFSRMPVGFYVLIQFDGTQRRTENKQVHLHNNILEWDDRIQLPSELSAKVQLSICASFEFSPMLGNGEILRTVEIDVGDLLNSGHLTTFAPVNGKPVSPCSSLLVNAERRRSTRPVVVTDHDDDLHWENSSDLAQTTDQGHNALLRYRKDQADENIAVSIEHFEHALTLCPPDHQCRAAALCNIAMAQFINCQVGGGFMGLSTSISSYREALTLRHFGHPDRPATLLHLAQALLYHYEKQGSEGPTPGEIVELAFEIRGICSVDSHERVAIDLLTETYTLYKAISYGSLTDVDMLIPTLRQAVQDIPPDYLSKLQRLINLALALQFRYHLRGDLDDLHEAFTTYEEAMQCPPGCYERKHEALGGARWVDKNADVAGPITLWLIDFMQRCLSTHESSDVLSRKATPDDNMPIFSTSPTPLLEGWAKLKLTSGSWEDALAASVGFIPSRLVIYRVICERLEKIDRVIDAAACFHQINTELVREIEDEQPNWIPGFKSRCRRKLEGLGDTAMDVRQYDEAISHYTIALSLNPSNAQTLYVKRSEVLATKGFWEDALNDANEAIKLNPSSPFGYERKHAALHGARRYGDAIDAFEMMLSKISPSSDSETRERSRLYVWPAETKETIRTIIANTIRDSPPVLVNTHSGYLDHKSAQSLAFELQPIFEELISSMTTGIDHSRIEHEVAQYYRYATFSHKWQEDEPLFQTVMRIAVYDLEGSPTRDKLKMFCKIAREAGLNWAWSDTCCIDKTDHFVLQETLVRMFKWYQDSSLTIVFLPDVHPVSQRGALTKSMWNTRAWTLQEYHASKVVRFYTEDWTLYMNLDIPNHKESPEITLEMERATGISARALMALHPGLNDIREKLHLASTRQTTLFEDEAYSLLGIFSMSLSVVYGEGDRSLGRLLAQLLTGSGDTSILAWTGRSGSFNSCLPANITVFSQLPTTHIPVAGRSTKPELAVARRVPFIASATELYDQLYDLPVPSFAGPRMRLPCLTFKLGRVSASWNGREGIVRANTTALGVVEIRTEEDLSRLDYLYLIHPWIDFLLDRQPVGNIAELTPEGDIQEPSVLGELPLFSDRSSIAPGAPQTRVARLAARFGLPFGGRSPDNASLLASTVSPIEKQRRVLQFITRIRQPFGALLFTSVGGHRPGAEYRRVAAETLITVQLEEITPMLLKRIYQDVQVLDVL